MMDVILPIAVGLGALGIGLFTGYLIPARKMKLIEAERQEKVDKIIEKAKEKAKDIQYRARQEMKQTLQEERAGLESEYHKRRDILNHRAKAMAKREVALEKRGEEIEQEEQSIQRLEEKAEVERKSIAQVREKYEEKRKEIVTELEKVAQISRSEAKNRLTEEMEEQARIDASKAITRIEEEAQEEAEKRAKRVIGISIQRFASEYVAERTIASVELPSDDIKGRLIGREGRNIRGL